MGRPSHTSSGDPNTYEELADDELRLSGEVVDWRTADLLLVLAIEQLGYPREARVQLRYANGMGIGPAEACIEGHPDVSGRDFGDVSMESLAIHLVRESIREECWPDTREVPADPVFDL